MNYKLIKNEVKVNKSELKVNWKLIQNELGVNCKWIKT
jgi:hypothetical protein